MADNDLIVSFRGDVSQLQSTIGQAKGSISSFGDGLKGAVAKADFGPLKDGFKQAGDSAQKAGGDSSSAFDKLKKTFEDLTLGVGAAGIAAATYLVGVGLAATAIGDATRRSAGAFNQTTEAIGALKAVATASGLSVDTLGKSLFDLQTKAKAGDEGTVTALKAIGLTARDVAGMGEDALAVRLAEAFSKSANSANKAATAVALFGSEAAGKLVPQLDQGAAHIRDIEAAADRAGTVIGPDLSAKLAGTSAAFQAANTAMRELRMTVDGELLQAFATFKPAIDGLVVTFTDVISNVTALAEWFYQLDGAARKNAESTGLLSSAAKAFSSAVVEATVYVEELGVRGAQYITSLGVSFNDLSGVAQAFGNDIMSIARTSAGAMYQAFHDAIAGIEALFGDLAASGRAALSFDLSGVRAGFAAFGSDAEATGAKLKAALNPSMFAGTTAAMAKMRADSAAQAAELDKVTARLEAQKKATLDLIAAGGMKAPAAGTKAVGDPAVHKKDDDKGKGDKDGVSAAMAEIDGEIEVARKGLAAKEALYERDTALKIISESEKLAKTKAAQDEEYAVEKALLEKKLGIDGLSVEQKAQVNAKLKELDARYAADTAKTFGKAAEEMVKPYFKAIDSMSSSLSSSITGILEHTSTIGDLFKNLAKTITSDFVKMGADVVADWAKRQVSMAVLAVAGQAQQTAAVTAGETARTAATGAGAAAQGAVTSASILGSIQASAAETFAGVFGFLSPLLGPAAAGPAATAQAAVASVALPSFATGSWSLPSDMIAQVHQGEMIVPSGPAAMMRAAAGGGGGSGSSAGAGGGDTHNHYHAHVTAMDSRDVSRWFRGNGKAVFQGMGAARSNGAGLGIKGA